MPPTTYNASTPSSVGAAGTVINSRGRLVWVPFVGAQRQRISTDRMTVLKPRCVSLGRVYTYFMDKDSGTGWTIRYFAPVAPGEGPEALTSVDALLDSAPLGDLSMVPPGRIGERIGLAWSTSIPIMRVELPNVKRFCAVSWSLSHCIDVRFSHTESVFPRRCLCPSMSMFAWS